MLGKILQSYLRFWATRYLHRAKPKIIAITGSVGKTSTKEAIFEVLKIKFGDQVRKSAGNLNTETGVPMAILGYASSVTKFYQWLPIILTAPFKSMAEPKVDYLILELAADKPGDIKYLTSFIKPSIAVLTAIGPSHLQAFGEIDKIIEEKTALLWALPHEGWAVFNLDDENVRKASYGGRYQKMTYAINQKADLVAENITSDMINYQPETKFKIKGKKDLTVLSPTLGGEANVYASLAAAAVGDILGLSPSEIKLGLEKIQPEKHRMNVLKGKNKTIIIDDCYNANPLSTRAALNALKDLKSGRKIIVLGDMKELGKISADAHKIIGQYAQPIAKNFVAVGPLAKNYEAPHYFKNTEQAISYLLPEIREGDIILVKASRSMGFEKIVEALRE